MKEVFEYLRSHFDSNIAEGDTQSEFKRRKDLAAFYKTHVKARHYFFCVKKCRKISCNVCFARRLPAEINIDFFPNPVPDASGEHYKPFEVR